MTTTKQLAKIAGVVETTIRNYSDRYGELLSPEARGERGNRRFNDEDVQTILSIVELRQQDVPPAEIIERLRRGDIYIDATPSHTTPSEPHHATPNAQEAPHETLMLPMVLSRLAAVERAQATAETQRAERVNAVITGIVIGVAITLLLVAVLKALGQL